MLLLLLRLFFCVHYKHPTQWYIYVYIYIYIYIHIERERKRETIHLHASGLLNIAKQRNKRRETEGLVLIMSSPLVGQTWPRSNPAAVGIYSPSADSVRLPVTPPYPPRLGTIYASPHTQSHIETSTRLHGGVRDKRHLASSTGTVTDRSPLLWGGREEMKYTSLRRGTD